MARGGVWLVALVPAGLVLSAHARIVVRAGLRTWSPALGTGALVLACLALAVLGLGPALGLYRTVTVLSGSMRPTFSPGDVIVVTPEPARDLRAGQVISYHIPVDGRPVVTHRVVRVIQPGDEPIVQTKGDANNAVDPWRAKLHGGTIWRYRLRAPLLGYPILALRTQRAHWLLVVFLPALLALYGVASIWRPAAPTRCTACADESVDAAWRRAPPQPSLPPRPLSQAGHHPSTPAPCRCRRLPSPLRPASPRP